jgi:hypothetical protein
MKITWKGIPVLLFESNAQHSVSKGWIMVEVRPYKLVRKNIRKPPWPKVSIWLGEGGFTSAIMAKNNIASLERRQKLYPIKKRKKNNDQTEARSQDLLGNIVNNVNEM